MNTKTFFSGAVLFFLFGIALAQHTSVLDPDSQPSITSKEITERAKERITDKSSLVVLDFEGLGNTDPINGFYNGGTSDQGFSGSDYGISFPSTAMGLITYDFGGSGNFSNPPSGITGLYYTAANTAINMAGGFETEISFYYSSASVPGLIEIYSELGGTGDLLASQSLPATGSFSTFSNITIPFTGMAKSVVISGAGNQSLFDDFAFIPYGSTPVPLRGWVIWIVGGLITMFIVLRSRRVLKAKY
jgi:hypothetical protein